MRCVEVLTQASYVLNYEWRMLRECRAWLVEHREQGGTAIYSAMLEAMLLHMRLLIEFFLSPYDQNRYPDDVRLVYWFPPTSCEFVSLRRRAERLKETQLMIHKRLAHLTLDRTKERVQWDLGLAKEVDELMIAFERLAGDRVDKCLRQLAGSDIVMADSFMACTTGGAEFATVVVIGERGNP